MSRDRRSAVRWTAAVLVALLGLLVLVLAIRADRTWFEVHTTWRYCAIEVEELDVFRRRRHLLEGLGVLLLVLSVPLGRLVAKLSAGGALRASIAVVLALVVCDVGLRFKKPPPPPPPRTDLPSVVPDPGTLYHLEPSHTTVVQLPERSVSYATDTDGNRAPVEGLKPDHDAPTLVFAGESITMGMGLLWEETYPALVGQHFSRQVVNLGVHGWGMDEVYQRTLDTLATYSHPLAIVTIVVTDQLERNVQTFRPRLAVEGDGFRRVEPEPELWRESPLRKLVQGLTHYHDAEAVEIAQALFRDTVRRARARGAIPLFVLTSYYKPCLPDATGAPSIERVLFEGTGLPYIRADIDPSWHLSDGHPDARADAKIAADIERALAAAGLGVP